MEAPPPYQPKKSKTGLIVGLIIGGIVLCCLLPIGGLVGAGFWGMGKIKPMAACGISLEAMQKAVVAYANDNGGKLPNAETWQDQVRPYYEKEVAAPKIKDQPFGFIPVSGEWGCEAEKGVKTTITYNSELSGKKLSDIENQADTIVLFETTDPGMNAHAKYDPAKLGDPPSRFPSAFWMVVPLTGGGKMLGKGGEPIKDKNVKATWKFD